MNNIKLNGKFNRVAQISMTTKVERVNCLLAILRITAWFVAPRENRIKRNIKPKKMKKLLKGYQQYEKNRSNY